MALNLDFTRSQFPGLDSDWIFFDNAGGSQIAWPVVRRMIEYCQGSFVQLGGSYDASRLADERLAGAVAWMAAYVNAADPSEIVLGTSTSMNMRVLSLGLARTFRPGDEVIHTNLDHEANIGPWADLAERGVTVKTWRVNPDSWTLELDELRSLLTPRTRLVALTHASNVVATINPIRAIADVVWRDFARAHGRAELADDTAALLSWAFELVAAHEQALATPLIELLESKRNVRIIGLPTADRSKRMPTIAFVVEGRNSDEIPAAVDRHRIAIRWGDFYAARLIDALGLRERNGVVRASMVHYNTVDEVKRLVRVLDELL